MMLLFLALDYVAIVDQVQAVLPELQWQGPSNVQFLDDEDTKFLEQRNDYRDF